MTRLLAFDIGTRRTGVAFGDSSDGVVVSLDTIQHTSMEELVKKAKNIADEKQVTHVVIGLPKLPSGMEGEQAAFVRTVGDEFSAFGWHITYLDERYTTSADTTYDGDAKSAIELLQMTLLRGFDK